MFATSVDDVKRVDAEPLVFELQEPKRPREIVESPEHARTEEFQKNAELASDKNALASNPESDSRLDLGEPFSRGDFEARELPSEAVPQGEEGVIAVNEETVEERQPPDVPRDPESGDLYAMNQAEKFTRDYLTDQRKVRNPGAQERLPKVRFDNQQSRAPLTGSLSFNTYEWEFAPYMLRLKERVERNIFPPPAFYRLGIISGETFLRFKIYPNGELKDLQLLQYEGHETLMQASLSAIEISAPYEPLPADFPEAFLEVTAKFNYFIRKHR